MPGGSGHTSRSRSLPSSSRGVRRATQADNQPLAARPLLRRIIRCRASRSVAIHFLALIIAASALAGCRAQANAEVESRRDAHLSVPRADLEGSWEGEFETPRRPIFITLHLDRGEEGWRGSLVALGRTHILRDVTPTAGGVQAVLVPGSEGFALEAALVDGRLVGAITEAGQAFPLELSRIPRLRPPRSREASWAQDLDALSQRFLRLDRSFGPEERSLFLEQIRDVRERVAELGDSEIIMRMAAAVALSGNAHTRLYLLRNRTELRRLPVRVWWFSDGLYVVRAMSQHRDLLGCRVDRLEGMPSASVGDSVAAAFAGNLSWTRYKSVYYMTSPEVLDGFGITADPESVELTLSECRPEPFRRTLTPLPLVRSEDPVEAWWDLSPRHREPGWVHVLDDSATPAPLYLLHPDRHYWFRYLDDRRLLYFQYSRASEMNDESIGDFGERLLAELERPDIRAFVVDLRFNTGGSLGLAQDLMDELEVRTRGIPRFVITGRATFSAGIAHVARWKEASRVTLVGEQVGDKRDFWSEGGNVILPNSGLAAHFANAFHSYSETPCPPEVPCFLDLSAPDLAPDIPVDASWSAYLAGIDDTLDAIRAALR